MRKQMWGGGTLMGITAGEERCPDSLYILLERWARDEETSQNCAALRDRDGGEQGCKEKSRLTTPAHQ